MVNYARLPERMTENRRGRHAAMQQELAEIDRQCVVLANQLGEEYDAAVKLSREARRWAARRGGCSAAAPPRCGTAARWPWSSSLPPSAPATAIGHRSSSPLSVARTPCCSARRDLRYKALMDVWLHIHVPLSFALLAALIAHIVSVFYYWG